MATTTANMQLKVFNLAPDLYDYVAVANNYTLIDQHDHSNGKGVQIGTAGIQNNAITAAKIANNTITVSQISLGNGIATVTSGADTSRPIASGTKGGFYSAIDSGAVYMSDGLYLRTLRGSRSYSDSRAATGGGVTSSLAGTPTYQLIGVTQGNDIFSLYSPTVSVYVPPAPTVNGAPTAIINVWFQTMWQESVWGTARAALFLTVPGGNNLVNQLKVAGTSGAPVGQETALQAAGNAVNTWTVLSTFSGGLAAGTTSNYTGDVTTGQAVWNGANGGPVSIFVGAPGFYQIGAMFKAVSGGATFIGDWRMYAEVKVFSDNSS